MGTITIKSDKADDLYFINEMAQRMGLKAEIEIGKDRLIAERKRKKPEDDDSRQKILKDIAEGMKEAREIIEGKKKGMTLKEVFENED